MPMNKGFQKWRF